MKKSTFARALLYTTEVIIPTIAESNLHIKNVFLTLALQMNLAQFSTLCTLINNLLITCYLNSQKNRKL